MAYDLNEKKQESVFSKRIKAGKRRTYFFDVRETRGNDYFLTITESRKRFDDNGYDRHKVFIYKEDFNKFTKALIESVDYVKTELMPDFDFDAFNHDTPYEGDDSNAATPAATTETTSEAPSMHADKTEAPQTESEPAGDTEKPASVDNGSTEEVDKW